jgi:hypothetical protein
MVVLAPLGVGLAVCIDPEGNRREVMTDLVGSLPPGATVLVHAGVALTAEGTP